MFREKDTLGAPVKQDIYCRIGHPGMYIRLNFPVNNSGWVRVIPVRFNPDTGQEKDACGGHPYFHSDCIQKTLPFLFLTGYRVISSDTL